MIRVRGLTKRRGDRTVLRDLTFDVGAGEVVAVVGPSGGGKSTLLRCLNGLEPFDSGEVEVGEHRLGPGVDPRRDAALLLAVRRKLGMVFQALNLFPHMSALDNLVEAPIHVLGEDPAAARARAAELLARVGLGTKGASLPRALSGGEQQRVAIARALMMRPEALLFDEPTSALDPVLAAEILGLVDELARDGQAMVVVTHSMRFARRTATRVLVLADGACVENGPPGQVLEAPAHPITKAFLAAIS